MNISIIIPLFNEEESLKELHAWIKKIMDKNNFTYEIIFVNDGSTDNSWNIIKELKKDNPEVKGIKFRTNYGKSPALFHGFKKAEGDVVITMDADLQDSPEEIPGLYKMIAEEGYDLVSGWKKKRYDGTFSKNIPSKIYNKVSRKITGLKLHDMNCGLKAYKKAVVKNIEVYGEMHRYIPYLAKNAGFCKIGEKVVKHQKRKYGTSKFGINRFFNGFLDLITLWFLNKFGKKPMHFFGTAGIIMFLIGFIAIIIVGVSKLVDLSKNIQARLITDLPAFYISITFIILGTLLFLAGFLGELIERNSNIRNNYKIEEDD